MSSLLEKFARNHLANLNEGREIPDFKAGDTVEVHIRIVEGSNSRIQIFTGVCLRRRNSQHGGAGSTFTVKKVSNGEIVERTFLLHSPIVAQIKLLKVGRIRRAKLYYMRYLTGKAARIKELNKFDSKRATKSANTSQKATSKIDSTKVEQKPSESDNNENVKNLSTISETANKDAKSSSSTTKDVQKEDVKSKDSKA